MKTLQNFIYESSTNNEINEGIIGWFKNLFKSKDPTFTKTVTSVTDSGYNILKDSSKNNDELLKEYTNHLKEIQNAKDADKRNDALKKSIEWLNTLKNDGKIKNDTVTQLQTVFIDTGYIIGKENKEEKVVKTTTDAINKLKKENPKAVETVQKETQKAKETIQKIETKDNKENKKTEKIKLTDIDTSKIDTSNFGEHIKIELQKEVKDSSDAKLLKNLLKKIDLPINNHTEEEDKIWIMWAMLDNKREEYINADAQVPKEIMNELDKLHTAAVKKSKEVEGSKEAANAKLAWKKRKNELQKQIIDDTSKAMVSLKEYLKKHDIKEP